MQRHSGRLVPGGVALVKNAFEHTEYIGLYVETIQPISKGESFMIENTTHLSASDNAWLCKHPAFTDDPSLIGYALFDVNHLMPIKPDDTDNHIQSKENELNLVL